jgi:linoleoyl-CoA desaturase
VNQVQASVKDEWTVLVITKVLYLLYALVLPTLLLPYSFAQVFLGFFVVHFVAGFILAVIFQPAHVTPDSAFPLPDEENNLENNFYIHQMITTQNFARKSRLFSWYVGGLNYQVEHHLFPTICHVHYAKLAPIVKATAEEYGIPYMEQETFRGAIWSHARSLYAFGRKPGAETVKIPQQVSVAA